MIAVTLLPAALVFLILLLNNEELMGKYKNTLMQNILGFSIVFLIITALYPLRPERYLSGDVSMNGNNMVEDKGIKI